ncbi:MAG: FeoA domain-containing protein [Desulforegulaceae bacterium]|nr:FeoA domain-containing protein [Desulforegulaceae bacterium]
MEELTKAKLEDIKSLLEEIGGKDIDKRLKVVNCLWESEAHSTAEDLIKEEALSCENLDIGFVEDTLSLLTRLGLVTRMEIDGGSLMYEPKYLGERHDHMICVDCGKIIEFEDPRLERIQEFVAQKHDFTLIRHRTELYGLCSSCSAERGEELLLKDAKAGEFLEVIKIKTGLGLSKKLASMGISTGSVIEVLNSNKGGQIIAAHQESRYILGKGITEKVYVKRIFNDKCFAGRNPACPYVSGNVENIMPMPACRGRAVFMSSLKNNDRGVILRTGGCKRLRRRLFEMGLLNGAEFEIVKYAPLKDPLEIIVRGTHISLRVEEAKNIMVRKIED